MIETLKNRFRLHRKPCGRVSALGARIFEYIGSKFMSNQSHRTPIILDVMTTADSQIGFNRRDTVNDLELFVGMLRVS